MSSRIPPKKAADHLSQCDDCKLFASRATLAKGVLQQHLLEVQPDETFAPGVLAALPQSKPALGLAAIQLLPASLALALVLSGWVAMATPSPSALLSTLAASSGDSWIEESADLDSVTANLSFEGSEATPEEDTLPDVFDWILDYESES